MRIKIFLSILMFLTIGNQLSLMALPAMYGARVTPAFSSHSNSFLFEVCWHPGSSDFPTSGPKVYISKAGVFVMAVMMYDFGAANCANAYTYQTSIYLEPGIYRYYTYAEFYPWGLRDPEEWSNDGPTVTNNVPSLSWTGETNYTLDGVNPESGLYTDTFMFRIRYTDADNDAPDSGYPKLHIKKAGSEISGSPFTMSETNAGDTLYTDGKLYSLSKTLLPGTDYTYYFEAQDKYDAVVTGTPLAPIDAPDVTNAPTLNWTGESNYVSDGINPETGDRNTSFAFRLKYTDTDNDAPGSGYPKVHIKKDGSEISGSPFTITEVDGGDTDYTDGKLYSLTKTLVPGSDYTYYFEAQDIYYGIATGTPLTPINAPDVSNNAPTLSWTGETNYTADGLNPESGLHTDTFIFRAKYNDADNDAPVSEYPKLHIKKDGSEISGSPFAMTEVNAGDIVYTDGKLYTYSKTLNPGTDYTYYFEAQDVFNDVATGTPLTPINAPDVSNNAPTLSWTGETNYTADGLNPESGLHTDTFIFRAKYNDADNDAPVSGYPKLHIKKDGSEISGSPFAMTETDGGDTTYTDGKLYTYSKILTSTGTDYTYYFEAQDIYNSFATGTPTSSVDDPDVSNNVPTLDWTGEANYINDGLNPETGDRNTNFIFRAKYTDSDNDAPAALYPKVHIKKGGSEISGSPFTMSEVSAGDTVYTDGKLYSLTKTLVPGTDYTYYFEAQDIYTGVATGTPLISINAPDISNNVPSLSWTAEANYISDGLNPETGDRNTNFIFRAKYTDLDNDAPAALYPKVHVKKEAWKYRAVLFL